MSRAENKTERLLKMEALLLAHPEGLTQSDIARHLGVDRSVIHRNLYDFQRIYPTIVHEDGKISLDRSAYLVKVAFTLHEATAIHLAARLMATRMDKHNPHAASALRKLGISLEKLAPRISDHVKQSADVMDEADQRQDPVYLQSLEKLTLAWAEQRKARVWHRSEKTGIVFEYLLCPYFIEPYAVGQTTHIIGRDDRSGKMRTLKIERIERVELTSDRYEIPAEFDPRVLLADAWGIWYTENEPVAVTLKFHPRVTQRVRETRWHRSEAETELPDGYILWQAKVAEPQEMIPWIRAWGADCEVLEPKELREILVRETKLLARVYGLENGQEQVPVKSKLIRLWGKTPYLSQNPNEFHPAIYHMLDVGNVARELLSEKVSPRWRKVMADALGANAETLDDWLPWMIALHDIGKLSASFQSQNIMQRQRLIDEGFSFGLQVWNNKPSHAEMGEVFIKSHLKFNLPDNLLRAMRDLTAGHHGFFSPAGRARENEVLLKQEPMEWNQARLDAVELLEKILLKHIPSPWPDPPNVSVAIMALTGFAIVCDWLGSDDDTFKPSAQVALEDYLVLCRERSQAVLKKAGFTQACKSTAPIVFSELFPERTARPIQSAIDAIPQSIIERPCLAIIEAPTGEGKTEAALALAHRLARAGGTDELYYALPTTATSNQMFGRLQHYLADNLGLGTQVKLVHGQAWLMEDDLRLQSLTNGQSGDSKGALEWFAPRKRALLAPFGVGTIDQTELAALNVKHVPLRMMGLAGKVLILDEVHAYDVYMTTIIVRLLEWLSAMGTSVILLSATLPKQRRMQLIQAYAPGVDVSSSENSYPSLYVVNSTLSHHATPRAQQAERNFMLQTKELHYTDDEAEAKANWLIEAVGKGGCVCWITNTVKNAQQIFEAVDRLADAGIERTLLHSQFPLNQRKQIEQIITSQYGPGITARPERGIVIGTQVLEQSLDLDFDVMVSDIAPIDFLLQRLGRLHRHDRSRPEQHRKPAFYINVEQSADGFDPGASRFVYDEFILRQTWAIIKDKAYITLPADYRPLIEAVYGVDEPDHDLKKAWDDLQTKEQNAADRAKVCILPAPDPEDPFSSLAAKQEFQESETKSGWLVAQTRLGEESISVIPMERAGHQASFVLDGKEFKINLKEEPVRETQLKMMQCSLRISNRQAVQALKVSTESTWPSEFNDAPILRDCQPLWLRNGEITLPIKNRSVHFKLDSRLGLIIKSEKGG
jgi:CRISPR-associated endonuclease/helicase Cas3